MICTKFSRNQMLLIATMITLTLGLNIQCFKPLTKYILSFSTLIKNSSIFSYFGFSVGRINLVLSSKSFLKDFKLLLNISPLQPSPRWTTIVQNFLPYFIYAKDISFLAFSNGVTKRMQKFWLNTISSNGGIDFSTLKTLFPQ